MRKRWIALIAVGVVLIAVLATAYFWGRSLFQMPQAQGVDSVIGEIGGERVLGVFSHPDDEQTVNGLFWRAHDRDGAYTAMVTMTAGEAGTQVPVVARQEDLGVVRTAEALKNSFHLGVDEHEVWDYPDGGVPQVDEDELVDRLAETIRRIEPDVVVGFWPESGATGHKDHMETGRVTELAIAQVAAEGGDYAGPDYLVYTISPTQALEMFGGEQGAFVVENQPDPHYKMDAEVGLKKDGWDIHASQEDYLQATYGLPTWLVYGLWDQEFYRVRDLATDPVPGAVGHPFHSLNAAANTARQDLAPDTRDMRTTQRRPMRRPPFHRTLARATCERASTRRSQLRRGHITVTNMSE